MGKEIKLSKKGNHHYVPQFHLRKWEKGNKKISQWGRTPHNNDLVCRQVTSAATAYSPGLYALEHVDDSKKQIIEQDIFGIIDNQAKPVMDKIIHNGVSSLSPAERNQWRRYLMAAQLRVPHMVERIKAQTKQYHEEKFSRPIPKLETREKSTTEETLLESMQKYHPARLANSPLRVMLGILENKKTIECIHRLHWLVKDVSMSSRGLLLGDVPYQEVHPLYKPGALISIPLSPTHIFLAGDTKDTIEHFIRMSPRELVKRSNISALTTAKKFVYGDAEKTFIDEHFLKNL